MLNISAHRVKKRLHKKLAFALENIKQHAAQFTSRLVKIFAFFFI